MQSETGLITHCERCSNACAEAEVLTEKLSVAEAEVRILLRQKRELEFRLTDLSQRMINVIRELDASYGIDEALDIRIRAALKMGDD